MDNMSPQQRMDSLNRGGAQLENKRRMKSQSYRRQSAPSLVITKALTRSKTLSRDSFVVSVCPETSPFVQSFLTGFDRTFLLHGHAQLKTGLQTQDRHLFLFTDVLVIAKAKSANHFKQKAQVCVREMWTAGCLEEVCEGTLIPERSFVMGWPTSNCVAVFSSTEHKDKWLSLLKSRIKEEKENEEPKTIPLRVYGKGINTFAVTKTLPVSNSDSSNEVIRLALQQFGIIGNVKDFQLWVISKRDSTPYPLIGHEFPFSIQMSHVRQPQGSGGSRDAVPTEGRQRATQVEQLQMYKQCQFILKPRPTELIHLQETTDFSQKPLKRRRSLIAWAFWRGSSSQLNELSLAGVPKGCLFGQPLGAVCIEDTLPKPVIDMLTFLYHEGSWTRGIFRRPAGARAVRELRDSLDAGEFQLPLTRDHVFIIAGVFKEFMRRIPGSLLCCELYEEWLDAVDEDDEEEEQVEDVQRMICRLPKENVLLLHHLLALLHGIQSNATENQMTSFNLSVCIAPSLLWPPGATDNPEVEGEGTRKICELVKFMIDHCQQILGEDPCSMFGGPPQRLTPEETESWQYPLTDSSYDSLENELDNSLGGSPSFCDHRENLCHKPLRGSLDSILTFSDYEQDNDPDTQQARLHRIGQSRAGAQEGDRGHCCPREDFPTADSSPSLGSPTLDTRHRPRRRSEPAIMYIKKLQPYSTDGLSGDDEELHSQSEARDQCRRREHGFGVQSAALEVSSSILSSTPNSPAPNYSSLDSLDSLSSDRPWAARRGLHIKTSIPSSTIPVSIISAWTSEEQPDHTACSKGSPPKEQRTLKTCGILHPNSWLKKDWRLSLTQQDNLKKQRENKTGGGPSEKLPTVNKVAPEKAGGKQVPSSKTKTSHRGSKDSTLLPEGDKPSVSEFKLPSPCLFYKQSGPTLSLFRRHKSTEDQGDPRLYQRRGSEPGRQLVERVSSLRRARLPSDPGLKVSEADSEGVTLEDRFCLSPYATKAVKDYFSSHPRSNPQSGQQVALALVESHREWLKRCSNPSAEPDFEQLLLAEESYV